MKKLFYCYTVFISMLFLMITACENDTIVTPEEQAAKDEEIIVAFLKSHSVSEEDSRILTLKDGQKSLYELATRDPSGLYYYIHQQGKGEYAAQKDTVKIHYEGFLLPVVTNVFDSSFERGYQEDIKLSTTIEGWRIGIPKFKYGIKTKEGSVTDIGKGYLFIPSGLAYKTTYRRGIPRNSCLGFRVELYNAVTP